MSDYNFILANKSRISTVDILRYIAEDLALIRSRVEGSQNGFAIDAANRIRAYSTILTERGY